MNPYSNKKLSPYARDLRKNMTKEERRLWYDFFKTLPVTVHRQKPIGQYIVDFYCAEAKLIVELDGSQHYEAEGRAQDKVRDDALCKQGFTVLRYSNLDVLQNFRGVCEDILRHMNIAKETL